MSNTTLRTVIIEKSKSIIDWLRTAIVWIMVIPIALWIIPITRSYLITIAAFDKDTVFAVQTLALAVVLASYAQLSQSIKRVVDKIDTEKIDNQGVLIEGGVHKMHERMAQLTNSIDKKSEKRIFVLGLNLGMSWPLIKGWLLDKKYQDWEIYLYCLAPSYVNQSDFLDKKWSAFINAQTDDILEFKEANKQFLLDNRISITIRHYSSIPGIHGFKLGNGDNFIAASQWTKGGAVLDGPAIYYEQILAANTSKRATFYRQLLQNWIDKAEANSIDPSVRQIK